MIIKDYLLDALNLLYPELCVACRKENPIQNAHLCVHCLSQFPETDHYDYPSENEMMDRFVGRVPLRFAAGLAYNYSEGIVQNILHGLKYQRKQDIGIVLGRRIGERLMESNQWELPDFIVPVPIHIIKKRKRGYNQCSLIANGINEVIKRKVVSDQLIKTKNNDSQTGMGRSDRVENILNSFHLRDSSKFNSKHVLLVDDVMTTGATLEACYLAFKDVVDVQFSVATVAISKS